MVYEGDTYYYVTDGNKNVTALLDAAGFRVAGYTYGPFGQVLSMDGALAEGGGLGGIIGGAIGYWAGSEIAVTVYDWYFQKLESEDATVCIIEE